MPLVKFNLEMEFGRENKFKTASGFLSRIANWCRWKDKIGNLYVIGRYKGHVYTLGPHYPALLVVILLIFGGSHVNFTVLKQKQFSSSVNLLITVFIYVMMSTTTIFLLLTAFCDPGVVAASNQLTPDDDIDEFNINTITDQNNLYCDRCEIFQSQTLGIRHCDECDVCIRHHDHHCPWMTKCIGEHNMR